ncbi:MAG: NnrS family protein [Candidatus Binatia bacterium]
MREPYRLFFPLGIVLAWSGVGHWFLHAVTVSAESWPFDQRSGPLWLLASQLALVEDYRPVFHSIVQIQGFMTSFAAGFLFTMIPRRTASEVAAPWQLATVASLLPATALAAWFGRLALSQILWLLAIAVLASFVIPRLAWKGQRRPPTSFVWIPLALAMGVTGSLFTGAFGVLGEQYLWLHNLGRLFLLQGMFLGLIVGVGGLVIPFFTRGAPPPDAGSGNGDRLLIVLHLGAAVLLIESFVLEVFVSVRWASVLRATVVLGALALAAGIWRRPSLPGLHRRLMWLSSWLIPSGYLLAAAFPEQRTAALHLVFIGGFATLAFCVAHHVVLGHGGYGALLAAWPPPLIAVTLLLACALGMRLLVGFDPQHFSMWLGGSAAAFLLASLCWGLFLLPRVLRGADPGASGS